MAEGNELKGRDGAGDYLTAALGRLRAAVEASGFDLTEVTLRFDEFDEEVELKAALTIRAGLLDLRPAPGGHSAAPSAGAAQGEGAGAAPRLTVEEFGRLEWEQTEDGIVTADPAHVPLIEKFLAARRDPEKLRAFIEQDLGGQWEEDTGPVHEDDQPGALGLDQEAQS